MRLLVTGGAGFIGTNVVHQLISYPSVERLVVIDCLTYAGKKENLDLLKSNKRFKFIKEDIRDKQAITNVMETEQITHVIHLAAESHVDRSIESPCNFIETNVLGTFNLLESCRSAWAGKWENHKFVHVSTDEVFGSLGREGSFTETSRYKPSSPYSASKAASDHLVNSYYITYGFPSIITNCSNNYGPFQNKEKLVPKVIDNILLNKDIPVYGNGNNVRDWLFVKDHVNALWLVLNTGEIGQSYNIGGDNEIKNIDLVTSICDLVDKRLGRLNGYSRNRIKYVSDRPGHDFRYAINSDKVQEELGWKCVYEFELALDLTIEWYLRKKINKFTHSNRKKKELVIE